MVRVSVILYLLHLFTSAVFAQGQDSLRSAPFALTANVNAEGNYQRGNVNRILAALRCDASIKNDDIEIEGAASYLYGEQNNQAAENDATFMLNTVFSPHTTFGWLSFCTVETSRLRKIDLRWQFGSGLKVTLLSSSLHTLKLSGVALFDVTEFPDTLRRSYRFSLRLKGKHHLIPDRLRFVHESFFQPSFLSLADLRCRTALSLEVPLSVVVAMRTSFIDSYESIVQAGRKRNDMQWTVGIALHW